MSLAMQILYLDGDSVWVGAAGDGSGVDVVVDGAVGALATHPPGARRRRRRRSVSSGRGLNG